SRVPAEHTGTASQGGTVKLPTSADCALAITGIVLARSSDPALSVESRRKERLVTAFPVVSGLFSAESFISFISNKMGSGVIVLAADLLTSALSGAYENGQSGKYTQGKASATPENQQFTEPA